MNNTTVLLIDCDGVLYSPNDLDPNAIIYAFNQTCADYGLPDAKVNYIENCTRDKPVKGFFNYINHIAQSIDIEIEDFFTRIINNIDYSALSPDTTGILDDLIQISRCCRLCICTDNHPQHLNKVLQIRFGINSKDLPFPCFHRLDFETEENFYQKCSPEAIRKLETYFNTPAKNFIWFDDSPEIAAAVTGQGCQCRLVTPEKTLRQYLDELKCQLGLR